MEVVKVVEVVETFGGDALDALVMDVQLIGLISWKLS